MRFYFRGIYAHYYSRVVIDFTGGSYSPYYRGGVMKYVKFIYFHPMIAKNSNGDTIKVKFPKRRPELTLIKGGLYER
ncbi:MAG: hypothetical protein EBT51_12770 [Flavobacteriaceae bacterium]|nr:hypothetical protein [Flavobacteriaceae bacterium]